MNNELIPFKEDGERVTCTPSADVTGKRFVSISGEINADGTYTIAPTEADGLVFGVAAWDAATGKKVTVITAQSGHIVPITAGGTIAAGESVKADAAGKAVVAAAGARAFGIALAGAVADGDARIQLTPHTA